MRSKAPLALMEQMVMILVFALAAAMCLQVFAKSDVISRRSQARDRAVVVAQSAAESIRHHGGDFEAALGGDGVSYDENWAPCAPEEAAYTLTVTRQDSGVPGLGTAAVQVCAGEDTLFALQVSWQEVGRDG